MHERVVRMHEPAREVEPSLRRRQCRQCRRCCQCRVVGKMVHRFRKAGHYGLAGIEKTASPEDVCHPRVRARPHHQRARQVGTKLFVRDERAPRLRNCRNVELGRRSVGKADPETSEHVILTVILQELHVDIELLAWKRLGKMEHRDVALTWRDRTAHAPPSGPSALRNARSSNGASVPASRTKRRIRVNTKLPSFARPGPCDGSERSGNASRRTAEMSLVGAGPSRS